MMIITEITVTMATTATLETRVTLVEVTPWTRSKVLPPLQLVPQQREQAPVQTSSGRTIDGSTQGKSRRCLPRRSRRSVRRMVKLKKETTNNRLTMKVGSSNADGGPSIPTLKT